MSKYKNHFAIEAVCLVIRDGKVTNKQLSEHFHVSQETITEWKAKHELFRWAIEYGIFINNTKAMSLVQHRLDNGYKDVTVTEQPNGTRKTVTKSGRISCNELESLTKIGLVNFGVSDEAKKRISLEKTQSIMTRWNRSKITTEWAFTEFEIEDIKPPRELEQAFDQEIENRRRKHYAESIKLILDNHFNGSYSFDMAAMLLEKLTDVEDGWKTLDKVYQQRERQKQREERQKALYQNNVVQLKAN